MKDHIIKLINASSKEYWVKYPDEGEELTKEQLAFIDKQNDELADKILKLVNFKNI